MKCIMKKCNKILQRFDVYCVSLSFVTSLSYARRVSQLKRKLIIFILFKPEILPELTIDIEWKNFAQFHRIFLRFVKKKYVQPLTYT